MLIVEEPVHVGSREHRTLYFPLNFAVNLRLL